MLKKLYCIVHSTSLIKILPFLKGGGVCISLVETEPIWENCIYFVAKNCHFWSFILVNFLSILSIKLTIFHKLKIGKLFSPRCKDFFLIKDMQTSSSPLELVRILWKMRGRFPLKDKQNPPSHKWWKLYERCGMCWIEWGK